MDVGPIRLPPGGKDSGAEAERPAGGGGPGGDLSRGSGPRRPLNETGDEDGGMADGAAVHIKWGGTG